MESCVDPGIPMMISLWILGFHPISMGYLYGSCDLNDPVWIERILQCSVNTEIVSVDPEIPVWNL